MPNSKDPYAVEDEGYLYVAYSNNEAWRGNLNSAELAVLPVASLTAVEDPGAN